MSDIHHLSDKEKEIAQLLKTVVDPEGWYMKLITMKKKNQSVWS